MGARWRMPSPMKSTRNVAVQQISAVHAAMIRRSGASDMRATMPRCVISRVLDSIGRKIGAADAKRPPDFADGAFSNRWNPAAQKTKLTATWRNFGRPLSAYRLCNEHYQDSQACDDWRRRRRVQFHPDASVETPEFQPRARQRSLAPAQVHQCSSERFGMADLLHREQSAGSRHLPSYSVGSSADENAASDRRLASH